LSGVTVGDRYAEGACPRAEEILRTCIVIGLGLGRSEQEMDEIAAAFRKVAEYCLSQKGATVR
jgi:dTDP-4-amino-4,6-dideoxygalactose transaminase